MSGVTRRELVAGFGAIGAATIMGGCASKAVAQEEDNSFAARPGAEFAKARDEGAEPLWGMFIDAGRCVDCGACLAACHRQNGLDEGMDFIRFIHDEMGGPSRKRTQVVPVQCMHCADTPCASVCPTKATYVDEGGIVKVDSTRCIGCKYCMAACPYQARVYDEQTGTVDKCRFCAVESLDGSSLHVSCVEACINNVRVFGDLNDPDSDVSKAIAKNNAQPIAGDLTEVKIFYAR